MSRSHLSGRLSSGARKCRRALSRNPRKSFWFRSFSSPRKRRAAVHRIVGTFLIFTLLALSTPSFAAGMVVASVREAHLSAAFHLNSSSALARFPVLLKNRLFEFFAGVQTPPQVVQRIEIYPGNLTFPANTDAAFTALAFDANNRQVAGRTVVWKLIDPTGRRAPQIIPRGRLRARLLGDWKVRAEIDGVSAEVNITVVGGARELPPQARAHQTTRIISSRTGLVRVIAASIDTAETTAVEQQEQNDLQQPATKQGEEKDDNPITRLNYNPESGWNDSNWTASDDPLNETGETPGTMLDDGAGNGNFQIEAPILSLPGRGDLDLSLKLHYNSRLWSKADNKITYDIDRGSPAPGWSLGFGKIVFAGKQGGCMMLEANGTRHGYTGSIMVHNDPPWSTNDRQVNFVGHTTDGSFINYTCSVWNYGTGSWGQATAKLPNGTTITYAQPRREINPNTGVETQRYPVELLPTLIEDVQGNQISIAYSDGNSDPNTNPLPYNATPQIRIITDTLGRTIVFNYDAQKRLTNVTAPGLGNQPERTLVRLNYAQLSLSYQFAPPLQPIVRDAASTLR